MRERHLKSKEREIQMERDSPIPSNHCFSVQQGVMGSSVQSHYFITGALTFSLSLALSVMETHTHAGDTQTS